MVLPENLLSLSEDHIDQLYKKVKDNEKVFRQIVELNKGFLIAFSKNKVKTDYFSNASIDEIFDKFVKVDGFTTRISNFNVGPNEEKELKHGEALIYIQSSGDSYERKYQILEKGVKELSTPFFMMH